VAGVDALRSKTAAADEHDGLSTLEIAEIKCSILRLPVALDQLRQLPVAW
jgi:hypothetical protein